MPATVITNRPAVTSNSSIRLNRCSTSAGANLPIGVEIVPVAVSISFPRYAPADRGPDYRAAGSSGMADPAGQRPW